MIQNDVLFYFECLYVQDWLWSRGGDHMTTAIGEIRATTSKALAFIVLFNGDLFEDDGDDGEFVRDLKRSICEGSVRF